MRGTDRYHRQKLLPQIGVAGQARLSAARVLLVGCGALGTVIADQLVRAGVGFLRIVDRDVVEWTNLQRQVLFDETDAQEATPKAVAAALRLSKINSNVTIEPVPADVHSGNVEMILGHAPHATSHEPQPTDHKPQSTSHKSFDLILDGTDNVATRYLINDVSVKHRIPWVYGAAVGTEGRAMLVVPGSTPCLRCVFPEPMNPSELPTCDTAGVLATASTIVASYQSTLAIKHLVGATIDPSMLTVDVWSGRFKQVNLTDARGHDCVCCALKQFKFLEGSPADTTTTLCGRDAVQVRPAGMMRVDLDPFAERWARVGTVERNRFFVRCSIDSQNLQLTLFPDGRLLISGIKDATKARSIYAQYVGA